MDARNFRFINKCFVSSPHITNIRITLLVSKFGKFINGQVSFRKPMAIAYSSGRTELKNISVTPTQLRLFKERAIREYRAKNEGAIKDYVYSTLIAKLKRIAPLNIVIGTISAALLVRYKGVESLMYLFLSAIIGLTLVPYLTQLFIRKA